MELQQENIIRCKNCDLWNEDEHSGHKSLGNYRCVCQYWSTEDGPTWYTGENEFCSNAEPKEDAINTYELDPSDDDFGLVLNSAVRYALGRRTYLPHTVISFITPLLPQLTYRTLSCLNRDIEEAIRLNGLGDEKIDEPAWKAFYDNVKQEIEDRREKQNGNQ